MMKPTCAVPAVTVARFLPAMVLALAWMSCFAAGEACEARSPATRVAVLELYTSEGCNSCPPADRWISGLSAGGLTPDRVIPMAFHVDYWDQLGWPDRMAKAQFSERQRMQARRNRANVVYTPQLLLNGADYRSLSSDARLRDRLQELNRLPPGADLSLRQRPEASGVGVNLDVRLIRPAAGAPVHAFIAITENRLHTAIQGGENQGKLLHHDFVVREFVGPLPIDTAGQVHWKSLMAVHADWKWPDLALVAFVQDEHSGEILQALRAPLCMTMQPP